MGKRVSFRCNGFADVDLADIQALAGVTALTLLPPQRPSRQDPQLLIQCANGNRIIVMRSLVGTCHFDLVLRDDTNSVIYEDEELPRQALMSLVAQAAEPRKPARAARKRARRRAR